MFLNIFKNARALELQFSIAFSDIEEYIWKLLPIVNTTNWEIYYIFEKQLINILKQSDNPKQRLDYLEEVKRWELYLEDLVQELCYWENGIWIINPIYVWKWESQKIKFEDRFKIEPFYWIKKRTN